MNRDYSVTYDELLEDVCGLIAAGVDDCLSSESIVGNIELALELFHQRSRGDAPCTREPATERRGWPKKGDKMRFLGRNGHDYQLEAAKKVFNIEAVYEVERFDLGDWKSYIRFVGIDGEFNHVMFDWADAAPPVRSAASTVEPVADLRAQVEQDQRDMIADDIASATSLVVEMHGINGRTSGKSYLRRERDIIIAALRAAPTTSPEPDAVREALNEVVTNGEWTSGDQSGEWKIPREVYLTATDALSRPAHGKDETIERCAQLCEDAADRTLAAAIRALKSGPADPRHDR